jgi:hypothetical protein
MIEVTIPREVAAKVLDALHIGKGYRAVCMLAGRGTQSTHTDNGKALDAAIAELQVALGVADRVTGADPQGNEDTK